MPAATIPRPLLSVIIPTLNEEERLPLLLSALAAQAEVAMEIIVGDGGSTDATIPCAEATGTRVVIGPRGRGAQMNAAARTAAGEFLLFLHADSGIDDHRLLARAAEEMRHGSVRTGHHRVAGHFRLRFRDTGPRNRRAYRYMEEKSTLNRHQATNGDQGFLLSRRFFEELGGFDETLPFLEDQQLASRIRERGTWITLPGTITTSARRFRREGFHRRHILMAIIMGLYSTGFHEFFHRAPDVYQAQHNTERLVLTPFFRVIRGVLREMPVRDRVVAWWRVGRYVRENTWQVFFFLDVLLRETFGWRHNRFLKAYDSVVAPIMNCPMVDLASTVLTYAWVMGVLQGWYRFRDHRALKAAGRDRHHSPT